jgi:hypothetical protein
MGDSNLAKIAFPLNPEESGGITRERLWEAAGIIEFEEGHYAC